MSVFQVARVGCVYTSYARFPSSFRAREGLTWRSRFPRHVDVMKKVARANRFERAPRRFAYRLKAHFTLSRLRRLSRAAAVTSPLLLTAADCLRSTRSGARHAQRLRETWVSEIKILECTGHGTCWASLETRVVASLRRWVAERSPVKHRLVPRRVGLCMAQCGLEVSCCVSV